MEHNKYIFDKLIDIAKRHINCAEDYKKIVSMCPHKKMSRGVGLLGMYLADNLMLNYIWSTGKPTKNENKRNYNYFFDNEGRLRLTERYDEDCQTLLDIIFYYYYNDLVEMVWLNIKKSCIAWTGFYEYKNGKLTTYVQTEDMKSFSIQGKSPDYYVEYLFDKEADYVIERKYFSNWIDEQPRETIIRHPKISNNLTDTIGADKCREPKDLRTFLESKIIEIISSWEEKNIYAISFLLNANESNNYNGCSNVTEFYISYNTEEDCGVAEPLSEQRWNYAFWRQNETAVIEANTNNEGIKILFDWYKKKKITNIGYEDLSNCYNERMEYIGKGPVGYYELLSEIIAVIKKIKETGFIKNKFNFEIPIIIHDLEYSWYTIEATRAVNSNGEADVFLKAMKELGIAD